MDAGSIQKVGGGGSIKGHPHKQKGQLCELQRCIFTFKLVKIGGHLPPCTSDYSVHN